MADFFGTLIDHIFITIFAIFLICFSVLYYKDVFCLSYLNEDIPKDYKALYKQSELIIQNIEETSHMDNAEQCFKEDSKKIVLKCKEGILEIHFNKDLTKVLNFEETNTKVLMVISARNALIISLVGACIIVMFGIITLKLHKFDEEMETVYY